MASAQCQMVAFIDDHRNVCGLEPICAMLRIATFSWATPRARPTQPVGRRGAMRRCVRRSAVKGHTGAGGPTRRCTRRPTNRERPRVSAGVQQNIRRTLWLMKVTE